MRTTHDRGQHTLIVYLTRVEQEHIAAQDARGRQLQADMERIRQGYAREHGQCGLFVMVSERAAL